LTALDAFTGRELRVDLGMVGDRIFFNNVSLGAYANLVHEPGYRANKLGTSRALLPTALRGDSPPTAMSFVDDAGQQYADALVLLVANNEYDLRPGSEFGVRRRLDAGVLQVSALRRTSGAGLAGVAIGLATERRRALADWVQWTSNHFRVDATTSQVPTAIDGEAAVLTPPIEFRVLPGALRALVPETAGPPLAESVRPFRWATIGRLYTVARGARA
jgi:diacylglycerol kinase family enzyme